MLDQELLGELRKVFSELECKIDLVHDDSPSESQAELIELLKDIEATNYKISVRSSGVASQAPAFSIFRNGKATGVRFRGIPGGHEFTSLVIAILNADNKGKMPEKNILNRIRRLKGPLRVRTYISLTCENCPDVVQALNLMALVHENFQHEMIDGAFAQDEIDQLKIQGVPSVIVDGKLLHSGRIGFLDLLIKLEAAFGSEAAAGPEEVADLGHFDVAVIGGGPAGASAAIYSVRKGLKTVLIGERMGGQVQDTRGIENLIGVTYTEGPQLAAQLYQHVSSYPVKLLEQRQVQKLEPGASKGAPKKLELNSGEVLTADSVIVATGARWREMGVPGEKEYLGKGVAFCPHCDGPFYKGKKIAVVGGGNSGVEAAIDLAGIVKEVVLLEFAENLKADEILVQKLKSLSNVSIVTNAQTSEILGADEKVNGLKYLDRKTGDSRTIELQGVFVQIGLIPNSQFLKGVVDLSKFGEVIIDEKCRTSVKGIYAAGDVTTTPYKQIIISMGEGAKAGLAAFEDRIYHS